MCDPYLFDLDTKETTTMAAKKSNQKKRPARGKRLSRIDLVDREAGDEQPSFTVYAVDRSGKSLAAAPVDEDGRFELSAKILEKAHRIVLGPESEDLSQVESERLVRFRPDHFRRIILADQAINILKNDTNSSEIIKELGQNFTNLLDRLSNYLTR